MKKSLRDKLDKKWSITIRMRDQWCQRHIGNNYSSRLNAHHIITKSQGDRLRWDVINGVSLCCIPCHKWGDGSAHTHPKEFEKWFKKTQPTKWKYLLKQRRKGLIQFKDYHYELIYGAIETLTPIKEIEKFL